LKPTGPSGAAMECTGIRSVCRKTWLELPGSYNPEGGGLVTGGDQSGGPFMLDGEPPHWGPAPTEMGERS